MNSGGWRILVSALIVTSTCALVGASVVDAFPSGGALPPQLVLVVQIAGAHGVPIDAVGVALNVTVTNPAVDGYATVFPCGDEPLASNVNYRADQTVPNFVISGLSADGALCVSTSQVTDIVLDLAGYVPAGSDLIALDAPTRFVDTRVNLGAAGPVEAASLTAVQIAGTSGVPADAGLVIFNATAVAPDGPGFLTVFPCGEPMPSTSTLNFAGGDIVPNLVVSRVGQGGKVCFYSTSRAHLVADVAAYAPAGIDGLSMLAAPQRLMDTRVGLGGPQAPVTQSGRSIQVGGVTGIPSDASSLLVNLTAVNGSAAGFAAAFACGSSVPFVSNVNFVSGSRATANLAFVALSPGGQLCLNTNVSVDLILDVSGYARGVGQIVPLGPQRIYDSREGVEPPCQRALRIVEPEIEIIDLRTGGLIARTAGLGAKANWRVGLSRDCKKIYAMSSDGVGDRAFTIDSGGAVLKSKQMPMFSASRNLIITDLGVLGLRDFTGISVFDVESGVDLFRLPMSLAPGPVAFWAAVGATADGSVVALSRHTNSIQPSLPTVVTFFTSDGFELWSWTAPAGAGSFELSPLGTYVSYYTLNQYHVVAAEDGTPIATIPGGLAIGMRDGNHWITDGTFMLCQKAGFDQPARGLRWDLFSPPKPLIPGAPDAPCVVAAS